MSVVGLPPKEEAHSEQFRWIDLLGERSDDRQSGTAGAELRIGRRIDASEIPAIAWPNVSFSLCVAIRFAQPTS